MDKENIHLPQDADTYSLGAGLSIYAKSDIKNLITINNNKAHYFANQAKKFRDEAKAHCENAKNYAESNSNVTYDQLIDLRTVLETEINKKQEIGDYALKNELPQNVSELENDLSYTTQDEVNSLVNNVIPDLSGNSDKYLCTDGKELSWEKIPREMMFSTKLLDHILTYKESKGWALQGTYVYKDAVAGSRYGYPDFYNKCLEEYNEATEMFGVVWKQPILTANGVMGGDSFAVEASSAQVDSTRNRDAYKSFDGNNTTKWGIKGTDSATNSRGWLTFYNPTPLRVNSITYTPSTDFPAEDLGDLEILGSDDNTTWTSLWTGSYVANQVQTFNVNSESFYKYYRIHIIKAGHTFAGLGDLTINAVQDIGIRKNSNGHLFYSISQKDKVDEVYNSIGTAWYYGIDTENERIFLPRNNWFEQASTSDVGQSVEAGLPNITGTIDPFSAGSNASIGTRNATGAFHTLSSGKVMTRGEVYDGTNGIGFNASRSNAIYGKSSTVQPNAVKKLLYICVGNTTSESAITDVVDVTTTENDTVPLFTGQYFDFKPNNLCWLKAGEQANSGSIYETCYNELINELTNPKYDLKVIETSAMQSGEDYSEYWKVNQDDIIFTTPTAINVAEQSTAGLYFKVANAVQNLELLDVGEVMETLAGKTDSVSAANASMPSDKYIDLTLGASGSTYIAPADGWYVVTKKSGASGTYLNIYKNDMYWDGKWEFDNTSKNHTVNCPAYKGEKVTVNFTMSGATQFFRFYYAQGAVSFI